MSANEKPKNKKNLTDYGLTTRVLHSDRFAKPEHGSLHKPIHTSIAYGYDDVQDLVNVFQNKGQGFAYARQSNPTVSALESKVATLEGCQQAVCFATGMGAIASIVLSLLSAGDHLISSAFLFGNTNSLFNTFNNAGIAVSFVDATDVNAVKAAYTDSTKMVFVETIANPVTQVAALDEIGAWCKENQLVYVVDNTMTTPCLFQAKDVSASLIMHSLSKYIGGHGDALGGAVIDTGLFDWDRYANINPSYLHLPAEKRGMTQLRKKGLRDVGASLSPEAAHTISVGAETLALRMERACANAHALAEFFSQHPKISRVFYPGLESHPQYQRSKDLFLGSGALMSIDIADVEQCFSFLNKLNLVISSSNLGDTRTLAIPVAHTIFYEMGAERRQSMGISDGMVRLSIGIEDLDDLRADFVQALD